MKRIISIVSVLVLLIAKSASADIIAPGPVSSALYKVGFPGLAYFIHQFGQEIFWIIIIIVIAVYITRKIENKIKANKMQKNEILK